MASPGSTGPKGFPDSCQEFKIDLHDGRQYMHGELEHEPDNERPPESAEPLSRGMLQC